MKIKRGFWKRVAMVVCCILACTAMLTVVGKWTGGSFDVVKQLKGERNKDNLLTLESYQSTMVTQTLLNGLELKVDEDGVIKISGKATEDYEGTIAILTLQPGTYTLGGYSTNLGKAGLKAVVNGAPHYSGVSNPDNGATFTIEETASVSIQLFVKKGAQFVVATTFEPTLTEGKTAIEFYK